MKRLPLNVQTLYADLAQGVTFSSVLPGSIFTHKVHGKTYLYTTERHGSKRVKRYLGPAKHADVLNKASEIRRAAEDAKLRRTTVSMLKRLGVPAPPLAMGRVMEAVANAGLFRKGIVLVGTGAYQTYSPAVGVALSAAVLITQDADLAAASLSIVSDFENDNMLQILRRADPSFVPQPGLDLRDLPKRFRSAAGLEVDVITRYRSRADEERAVVIPELACSAQPFRYIEYLITDPMPIVALYGSGVQVLVPQPARYAVHKLIVAQIRSESSAKRVKDLAQAKELIQALNLTDVRAIEDALFDARRRGAKWTTHIDRSLQEIHLESHPQ